MSRKACPDGRINRAGRPSIRRILSAIAVTALLMVINGHRLEAATTDKTVGDHEEADGREVDGQPSWAKETAVNDEKILSRKRRYLIFQPGTSLQLGECGARWMGNVGRDH